LERTGIVKTLGTQHFFRLRTQAFHYAWSHLEAGHADTCPLVVARPVNDEANGRPGYRATGPATGHSSRAEGKRKHPAVSE
jgi:hypothetical protein